MVLKIGHKIFSVALIVVTLMLVVAVYSIVLTEKIAEELDIVSKKQLPLSETVGQINVHVLEQAVLIQRLFADHHDMKTTLNRIESLDSRIEREFERAYLLIDENAVIPQRVATIQNLRESIERVEAEYRVYEAEGLELLDLLNAQQTAAFEAKLPDFNRLQAAVDDEIGRLHRALELLADTAVARTDENQKRLLHLNIILTTLGALLGLGAAGLITLGLVRNIRTLARAAAEIERGVLDVDIAVTTRDEVGQLGHSFNTMAEGLRTKERIKETFGKYVDRRIVEGLLDDPNFAQAAGRRCEMTVMFIDLQGYTTLSESMESEDLLRLLNLFLSKMTAAVAAKRGVINDFQGDAVMAFWGPPFTGEEDHAELACEAAIMALRNFEEFKAQVAEALHCDARKLALAMRIGIATGPVVAGNVGSEASLKFTVIGDVVNLGARLEGANKAYGTTIMLSQRTRDLVQEHLKTRELDLVRVKGKRAVTRIFELSEPWQDRSPLDPALSAYRQQKWDVAEGLFKEISSKFPKDPVPKRYLARIEQLRATPMDPDWDGVWAFKTK